MWRQCCIRINHCQLRCSLDTIFPFPKSNSYSPFPAIQIYWQYFKAQSLHSLVQENNDVSWIRHEPEMTGSDILILNPDEEVEQHFSQKRGYFTRKRKSLKRNLFWLPEYTILFAPINKAIDKTVRIEHIKTCKKLTQHSLSWLFKGLEMPFTREKLFLRMCAQIILEPTDRIVIRSRFWTTYFHWEKGENHLKCFLKDSLWKEGSHF